MHASRTRQVPTRLLVAPIVVGDESTSFRPGSVEAADLDADGDLDLISANRARPPFGSVPGSVSIFRQTSRGTPSTCLPTEAHTGSCRLTTWASVHP